MTSLLNSGTVSIGDKVYIPELGVIAEVSELHKDVKNYITKVKLVKEDGTVEIIEVANLVVEGVILLRKIVFSEVVKAAWSWFSNLFRKKQPSV